MSDGTQNRGRRGLKAVRQAGRAKIGDPNLYETAAELILVIVIPFALIAGLVDIAASVWDAIDYGRAGFGSVTDPGIDLRSMARIAAWNVTHMLDRVSLALIAVVACEAYAWHLRTKRQRG